MKSLTESQIETVNNFLNYKNMLKIKYKNMYDAMNILKDTIENPSERTEELISIVQECSFCMQRYDNIIINNDNVLVFNTIHGKVALEDDEKKNMAIQELLFFMNDFVCAVGKLTLYLKDTKKVGECNVEISQCQSHIESMISIIMKQ